MDLSSRERLEMDIFDEAERKAGHAKDQDHGQDDISTLGMKIPRTNVRSKISMFGLRNPFLLS